MKLAIYLTLLAISSFVSSQSPDDPNFLISNPWQVTASIPANLANANCCMPGGLINMNSDKYTTQQVLLNATQWNGDLCTDLSLTPDSFIAFPFSNTSSFNQLVADGDRTSFVDGESVILSIGNYSVNNGIVSWSFSMNFENTTFQGGICSVTVTSNSITPDDPNFLVSNPWQVTSTAPADLAEANCCMPEGLIYMNRDKYTTQQVLLNATQWNGDLCTDLGLNPDVELIFPFSNTSSFNQLAASVYQSEAVARFNGEPLIYNIGNYSDIDGVVSWSFYINFAATSYQGEICSVTLTTPNSTLISS